MEDRVVRVVAAEEDRVLEREDEEVRKLVIVL